MDVGFGGEYGKGVGGKRDLGFGWLWIRGGGISIEIVLF